MRRISAAPVCSAVLLLALAGCSDDGADKDDDVAGATDALAALAKGLTNQDAPLVGVGFIQKNGVDAVQRYGEIVDGMGDLAPTVDAGEVEVDGRTATGTLDWSWTVLDSAEPWTYETSVELQRADGSWQVVWDPELVEPS